MRGIAVVAVLVLTGCVSGARPEAMTTYSPPIPQSFDERFSVVSVDGGRETNPLWKSEVSNAAFREALIASLTNAGLYDSMALFAIVAVIEELDQPFFGADMTVLSTVNYTIADASDNVVFERKIRTPFTADFAQSFYGALRLQMANEGSMKANIDHFIAELLKTDLVPNEDDANIS